MSMGRHSEAAFETVIEAHLLRRRIEVDGPNAQSSSEN